jgi:hypothetical protein
MVRKVGAQLVLSIATIGGLFTLWVAYRESLSQFGVEPGRGFDVFTFAIILGGLLVLLGALNGWRAGSTGERLASSLLVMAGGVISLAVAGKFHDGKATAAFDGGLVAAASAVVFMVASVVLPRLEGTAAPAAS